MLRRLERERGRGLGENTRERRGRNAESGKASKDERGDLKGGKAYGVC